jgi:long-chain-fatty-acid---luciferin-component ligase
MSSAPTASPGRPPVDEAWILNADRAPAEPAEHIAAVDLLEDLLYQSDDVFALPPERVAELRVSVLRRALAHHVTGCPDYARFARSAALREDALIDEESLASVPLIPSSVFKRRDVVTKPVDGSVRVCVSSGTQGGRSRVHRDSTTLERFVGSIAQGAKLLGVDEDEDALIHVLGPDTDEAGDLWFSYVLSIVDLLHPTVFHVRGGVFDPEPVLDALAGAPRGERQLVLGPPVFVMKLAQFALDRGVRLDVGAGGGLVITAGGWKRFSGAALSRREMTGLAVRAFGLTGEADVRDCFNMVELNTVLFECAAHVKHIPPWLWITARDPGTLRPLPSGEEGVLAYLDALPTSYPGFILGDDFGVVVKDHACRCGRRSDTFEVSRRIQTIEARGCALKMDGAVKLPGDGRPNTDGEHTR